jgi:tRNA uridine 5-carboxymethylaminomethyl modification enzyme
LENTPNLYLKQGEVCDIVDNGEEKIVKTVVGDEFSCRAIVFATGVYLNSDIVIGPYVENVGPNGFKNAKYLSNCLKKLGIKLLRFKTGTPARVNGRSIDYSQLQEQKGEENIQTFSFLTKKKPKNVSSCYLTYTNENTHKIIRDNLYRNPTISGEIKGIGPRYCPSIETKIVRFADKDKHQLFLEPEALSTNEVYIQGFSTSMPTDVQKDMIHSVKGLENAEIMRDSYAIEYDCIDPVQLLPTLGLKDRKGFYFAGQINGTSGYEEAAAQGIIAGINASLYLRNKEELVLTRSDAYIGVLIDDLVTKKNVEPYRMMTSRAEYRLLLRQDNADLRLREIGYDIGLVSQDEIKATRRKAENIHKEIERVKKTYLGANDEVNNFLLEHHSTSISSGITIAELCKRPELSYDILREVDPERPKLTFGEREEVSIELKYEGYLKREAEQVKSFKRMETKKIPLWINYEEIKNLRLEARQKLAAIKPENIGMASRISGVSPADISVLLIYIESKGQHHE